MTTQMPKLEDMLAVHPEVLRRLGKTVEEIAAMKLGEFAALSFEKGIVWNVGTEDGIVDGLTVTITEGPAATAA